MNDKCPKCGADMDMDGKYVIDFACGSIKNKSGGFLQRNACKDRQIAALKARLEAWRDLADIVRPMDELKAVKKLEDLGEL